MKSFMITLISVFLIIVAIIGFNSYDSRFSSQRWIEEPDKREKMVYTFIKKYQIQTLTRQEVINLLGDALPKNRYPSGMIKVVYPTGKEGSYQDLKLDDDNSIVYFLSSRISTYEDQVLYIRVDESQKVIDFAIFYFIT